MGKNKILTIKLYHKLNLAFHEYLSYHKDNNTKPNLAEFYVKLRRNDQEFRGFDNKQLDNKIIDYRKMYGKLKWPNITEMDTYIKPKAAMLLNNSRSAMLAGIEIHNKPVFSYRYEITSILIINAWELLMKAYIHNNLPQKSLIRDDGKSIEFEKCLNCIRNDIGKEFYAILGNLRLLYDYRCRVIHYYSKASDPGIWSLIAQSVYLYFDFFKKHFKLAYPKNDDFVILPIGFKKPVNPVQFIKSEVNSESIDTETNKLLKRIINWTKVLEKNNVEHGVIYDYNISVVHPKSSKNADLFVKFSDNADGEGVSIEKVIEKVKVGGEGVQLSIAEERLIKEKYKLSYNQLKKKLKLKYPELKIHTKFNGIMRDNIKGNPAFHFAIYLDPISRKGTKRDYYCEEAIEEVIKLYKEE